MTLVIILYDAYHTLKLIQRTHKILSRETASVLRFVTFVTFARSVALNLFIKMKCDFLK